MQIDRDDLVKLLKEDVITIVFTKVGGSTRTMNATLEPSRLPLKENKSLLRKPIMPSPALIRVFDVDVQGWRSLYIESITEIKGFSIVWDRFLVAE